MAGTGIQFGGSGMTSRVWVSGVLKSWGIGLDQGLRWKNPGADWTPPIPEVTDPSPKQSIEIQRQFNGYAVDPKFFPQVAIWDRKRFKKAKDIFTAGSFYAVKGRLAQALKTVDLGKGGLVPFQMYQDDLVTPEPGEFFILNFSEPKDSFVGEQSKNASPLGYLNKQKNIEEWDIKFAVKDGDIAVTAAAREGPDLWCEKKIFCGDIFMSEALVTAIRKGGVTMDLCLTECRIVEVG
jgi:hypothetical protein